MTIRKAASVAVLGLTLATGGCGHPAVESIETTASVPVTAEPARIDTLRSTIVVTGTVAPAPGADWTITAPESGRIVEMPRAEGETVRRGDLLVRFEIPGLAAALAARQAEVAQAVARATNARTAAERTSGLFDRGVASRREVEEATRDRAEAEAALAQAESAEEAAATLAGRAVVRARFAGIVARRWHGENDMVDGGMADPVLRVLDPARLEVVAAVPVGELARVLPGRAARVFDPAGGDDEAAVVLTRPATLDPTTATAEIRLAFQAVTWLAVGTPVQVEIAADERPGALVVPTAALIREAEETCVMLAGADGKAHRRSVTLGLVARDLAQVTEGLAEGDLVIVRGHAALPDGAAITVSR